MTRKERMFPPTRPSDADSSASSSDAPHHRVHPGTNAPIPARGPIFPATRASRPRSYRERAPNPTAGELGAGPGDVPEHAIAGEDTPDDQLRREANRLERRRGHIALIEGGLAEAHRFLNGLRDRAAELEKLEDVRFLTGITDRFRGIDAKAAELEGQLSRIGARVTDLVHSIEVLETRRDAAEQAIKVLEAQAAGEHPQNEDDGAGGAGDAEPKGKPHKPRR